MYESGEDMLYTDVYESGYQTDIRLGKKVNIGIGSKDIPIRKIPTYWTRLREDQEVTQLFRHRKEDELGHADDSDGSDSSVQNRLSHGQLLNKYEILEGKIFNAFRGLKKMIGKRIPICTTADSLLLSS